MFELQDHHRQMFGDVQRMLVEAEPILTQFQLGEVDFAELVAVWDRFRSRIAHLDLLPASCAIRGLLVRGPTARVPTLPDDLVRFRDQLFCWGTGQSRTWEEFRASEKYSDLASVISGFAGFRRSWSYFLAFFFSAHPDVLGVRGTELDDEHQDGGQDNPAGVGNGPGRRRLPPMDKRVLDFIKQLEQEGLTQPEIHEKVKDRFKDEFPDLLTIGWQALFQRLRKSAGPQPPLPN